jgi:hypothetical protein
LSRRLIVYLRRNYTHYSLIAHLGLQSQGFIPTRKQGEAMLQVSAGGPNTGSGRTLTMPEPKTKHFMRLLVQLTKGSA